MSRKVFAYIVIVLILLIVAINLVSSTYSIFSLIVDIPKIFDNGVVILKTLRC